MRSTPQLKDLQQSDYEQHNQDEALSKDDVFEVLSNPRRRFTIKYLNRTDDGTVSLRTLAEELAAWENDVSVREVNYKQRKRVYISLYQTHLPKMDRLGLVEYDSSSGVVQSTPELADIHSRISEESNEPDRWGRTTLVVSSACFGLVLAVAAGLLPFGDGSGIWLALAVSTAVLLVSIAQYLSRST